jgi:glycosyltransferase involved in cell wall biosynthesis
MKILHIDTGRELRGGQHQLLLLLAGLAARGHEQILLARECTRRGFPGREPGLLNLLRAARGVDLIHAHDGRGHTLAALAPTGKPLIVSRRVAFPIRQNPVSKRNYARADHFIAISSHVRRQLLEATVAPSKISIVYDGVLLDKALDTIPSARGSYVIAPQINDPLKGASLLQNACRQAGVELRFSADLPADLPRAAAFVYLSENEGLGSAILLAMGRKTPVIASRIGGIPEIVEHEVTGLLVENRAEDVARALRRLLDDSALARRCAEAAYQRVSECFRDDIMVRQTEQIYRAVLERRPPS